MKLTDLPDYIQNSDFYMNELEKDDEDICIDSTYLFKDIKTINDMNDFKEMFEQINYWKIINIPDIFYEFINENFEECLLILRSMDTTIEENTEKIIEYKKENRVETKFAIQHFYPTIVTDQIFNNKLNSIRLIIESYFSFEIIKDTFFKGQITHAKCLALLNLYYYYSMTNISSDYLDFCDEDFLKYLMNCKNVNESIINDLKIKFIDFSITVLYDYVIDEDYEYDQFKINIELKINEYIIGNIISNKIDNNTEKFYLDSYKDFINILKTSDGNSGFYHLFDDYGIKCDFSNKVIIFSFDNDNINTITCSIPFNIFNRNKIIKDLENIERENMI
jgi:hypothetical protein